MRFKFSTIRQAIAGRLFRAGTQVSPSAPELTAYGYCEAAHQLNLAGRSAEADELLLAALKIHPVSEDILFSLVSLASQRRRWLEASERAAQLREHFPDNALGYVAGIGAHTELGQGSLAEELVRIGAERLPGHLDIQVAHTRLVTRHAAPAEALAHWSKVKSSHPNSPVGYVEVARILAQGGRLEEAEGVLSPAVRSFPDDLGVAHTWAWLAISRRDWGEALKRWTAIGTRFPDSAAYRHGMFIALREADQADEAARFIAEGRQAFPDEHVLAFEQAGLADRHSSPEQALALWEGVHAAFPDLPRATSALAAALQRAKRDEDADRAIVEGLRRFPADEQLLAAWAKLAADRRDLPLCLERWTRFREAHPDSVTGVVGLGTALRELGRVADAASLLSAHADRLPDNLELNYQCALTYTQLRDWNQALPRWVALKRDHPHHEVVASGIVHALWQVNLDNLEHADGGVCFEIPAELKDDADGVTDKSALRDMFMNFESLGADCEFGMVQRRYEAEPLSLMRWATSPPDLLAEALRQRFAGVGDPDQTTLKVVNGEFNMRVERYQMLSHTFVFENTTDAAKFHVTQCRRMSFLVRKLLEDLEAAEKIFIYKYDPGISDAQMHQLRDAVLAYNRDNLILCMRLQDDDNESGSVRLESPGLMIGYVDRFSTVDISMDAWRTVCQSALALRANRVHVPA